MKPETLSRFKNASRRALSWFAKFARAVTPSPDWFRLDQADGRNTIYIYGTITPFPWWEGEISARDIVGQLDGMTGDLSVRINSDGGSVFDGVAIYSLLNEYDRGKVTIHVDGLAASIASVIAMAGDEIVMTEAGSMMIHNPSTIIWGNADELRHEADVLDEIKDQIVAVYVRRTGRDEAEIRDWMSAEFWMKGARAVELGFADRLAEDSDELPENTPEDYRNLRDETLKLDPPKGRSNQQSPTRQKGVEEGAPTPRLAIRERELELLKLKTNN